MTSLAHPRHALAAALGAAALAATSGAALASSHREAPAITNSPKVDSTDFYMFRSYEAGRDGYVTLIANYFPLQDAYGGPNYFKMDPNALYEIHIDNNGDAREDITFQFKFRNTLADIKVPALGAEVSIPLSQGGTITEVNSPNSNVREQFTLDIVRGDRRTGTKAAVVNASGGAALFDKPVDNIGSKTFPNGYAAYAAQHVYTATIPGCAMPAKVFAGQRKEGFAVNLGTIFDLVNAPLAVITDPTLIGAVPNTIGNKNVTSLAVEVHRDCLTVAAGATGTNAVIGGWQTASLRQGQLLSGSPRSGYDTRSLNVGPWVQVSRLGSPLVNEVVIGVKDKDRFNASKPSADAQFAQYVTNPTLPVLISAVQNLGAAAPTNAGRGDLVAAFLTGIQGVNQLTTVTPSEMLRLNTAIPPVAFAQQNRLGIVGNILAAGSDNAGFPNGRRPKDDVVDIALVAVMGGLCVANGTTDALKFGAACNPSAVAAPLRANGTNGIPTVFNLHDAVDQAAETFLPGFPYLNTPLPGTPPAP
ncbi:MAG TPA: DUF4331 domain-containing protein [Methylibium sp.]|uniref:DUF4331 domain-containing protein n=1 Tax=Methylibium sp. TaxID=2067992 RepID=UPI002DBF0AA7|nr:DUF4331 domain-containing protein [Methylibium sp.]HEU4459619.1 DUF4331 domain-containing protein [Methylibium sp.]